MELGRFKVCFAYSHLVCRFDVEKNIQLALLSDRDLICCDRQYARNDKYQKETHYLGGRRRKDKIEHSEFIILQYVYMYIDVIHFQYKKLQNGLYYHHLCFMCTYYHVPLEHSVFTVLNCKLPHMNLHSGKNVAANWCRAHIIPVLQGENMEAGYIGITNLHMIKVAVFLS